MKRLVLVDGNALLHRAYHATPPLSTSSGELINGVYSFTSMLLKSISDLKPDYLAIAWDEHAPTFRHQQYTQYKATRGPADEGLISQYKRIHQIIAALNIPEFSLAGFEADDLIGTLSQQAAKAGVEVIILTGDRDIMQVIDQNIKILMPRKTLMDVGLYGEEEFVARFGFYPKQLIDYKSLAGDQSDNIPGVAGIGEVTATKLIHRFGSIEKIYSLKNLKTLPQRQQKLLAEGAESAVMSKKLATLDLQAPIKLDLKKCAVHEYDHQKATELFEELEFKSLISRLPENSHPGGSAATDRISKDFIASLQNDKYSPLAGSDFAASTIKGDQAEKLDAAVTPVLEKMSQTGILVDLKFLAKLGKNFKANLATLEKAIYRQVGHEFNLNSPKQLSVVLFDELKLPVFRKTKTGRSTDEETLHQLAAHPVAEELLQYRQLFKLVSTYIDALPKYADPSTSSRQARIHSTFNVEGAATGRLSSQNPNLQNIPIKGELGAELRKAFVSPKGKVILAADYSQIELRIMAHLANDPGLKRAFAEGLDIHAATAAKIFNVPVGEVTKHQRAIGKTMNFATLYGQGPHALSRQLGVSYEVAREYIAEYFEQFPKVRQWMQKTLEFGYEHGYVETLLGRRRYIPELKVANRMFKAAGERAAVNHPVQGTAADMIKLAMVEISNINHGMIEDCQMILQVHDELLFECDPKEVQEMAKMVKEKMEHALKLSVPVVVDLKVGKNWGEMEILHIDP